MSPPRFAPEASVSARTESRGSRVQQLGARAGGPGTLDSTGPAPDWRLSAACVDHDLNIFFPISNVGAVAQQQIVEAKRICGDCPVRRACLDWALEVGPEFGIFGGHTEDERRLLRARASTPVRRRDQPLGYGHRSEEAVAEALEPH